MEQVGGWRKPLVVYHDLLLLRPVVSKNSRSTNTNVRDTCSFVERRWWSCSDEHIMLFESPIMLCFNAPTNILLCQCKMSYYVCLLSATSEHNVHVPSTEGLPSFFCELIDHVLRQDVHVVYMLHLCMLASVVPIASSVYVLTWRVQRIASTPDPTQFFNVAHLLLIFESIQY